ncbi:uncharacterized protein LOC123554198 isoform X2 [Mercenaria mercenaria]|uniref:uncharacterized protein LOC123554198 isoform X2 n=1 Tax=Mercenaria mercenaria TaxID=6596 RepID=UPI00234F9068|nr:uncharacterized protein LOC123554198 isoform X2 [Mercenaria mercenaria]
MISMMEIILPLMVIAIVGSDALDVDEDVNIVDVERFDGDMDLCREGEVCADIFNFTRDHGDGTGRLESRFLQNCICPAGTPQCQQSGPQLIFRETRTQSMVTCEPAEEFPVCQGDEIAKEQHNLGYYVYYKINCVCPNNDRPGDFRNKMTTVKRWNEMTPEEREVAERNPRSRFFKCRRPSPRGGGRF